MKPYQYRNKNYSLLKPGFTTVFIKPLLKVVPSGVSANLITILSRLFLYGAVYLAFDHARLGAISFIAVPILLLMFVVGDALDGAQAQRAGTASPLGEFWDHYLDSFNVGLLLFVLIAIFDVHHPWIVAAVLYTSYLAAVATFYEQFKTGWFVAGPVGAKEMILLSAIMILLANFPVILTAYQDDFAYGLSFVEWVLVFTAVGAGITFIKNLNGIADVTYGIWLFCGGFLLIVVFGTMLFSPWQFVIVSTLYASWYIGKLMTAHLVDGVERSTGLFTPIVVLLAYFMHSLYPANTFIIVTAYMTINIILLVHRPWGALK